MFLPIQCNSVNSPSLLCGSKLGGFCSSYNGKEGENILLFEYLDVSTKRMLACDIVIALSSGEIFLHDYLLLADGNWRNSYGDVFGSLVALLPEIAISARLVNREEIAEFTVEAH